MICAVLSIVRCLVGQMILACDTPPWNMHALPFHSTFCKKSAKNIREEVFFPRGYCDYFVICSATVSTS